MAGDEWKRSMMDYSCYVLHVKKGYEDREASIVDQFGRLNMAFEWVLEHDKGELVPELLQEFGYHHYDMPPAAISCAMKHMQRIDWIKQNGFCQPADHLIDTIDRALGLPILWSVPTVVSQGSHTGFFSSSIQSREKTGWLKQMEWTLKVVRRKYIYPLLGKDVRQGGPKDKGD
jgi:hypothetical protein